MKKILCSLFILLLFPLMVYADEPKPKVLTLNYEIQDNTVLFDGTTEEGSHAVMCKLLNSTNIEVAKQSFEVENSSFAGMLIAPVTGDYTLTCANYEGGDFKIQEITIANLATFTVTFNSNDGSSIDPVNVTYGNTVNQPVDPTKNDFDFGGWYEDVTLTTSFDFSKKITADITLYAKWVIPSNQVQVIFFGENGTYQVDFANGDGFVDQGVLGEAVNSSNRYFVPVGEEVILTAVANNGYHFKGWYNTHEVDTDGHGHMEWVVDDLVSSNAVFEFTPENFANLRPVFEEDSNVVTVTFNTNGGSEIDPINVEIGQQLQLPQNPTRDGYVFIDWYEDDTLTTWFDPSREINASFTLYAKWHEGEARDADQLQIWSAVGGKVAAQYTPSEPNVYELEAKDGNDYVEHGEVVQFYVGDTVTAKAQAMEGYRFVGWKHVDIEYGPENPSDEHPSACMGEVFATSETYTYTPTVTVVDGDNQPIKYVCADFEEDNGENPNTGGNEDPNTGGNEDPNTGGNEDPNTGGNEDPNTGGNEDPSNGDQEYTVSDEGIAVTFTEVAGHTFSVEISDYTTMTDAELAAQEEPMTREEYEAALETLVDAVKEKGVLLSILEINVFDEDHHKVVINDEVEIRIPLTSELKSKYNTFKLVYLDADDDGNLVLGSVSNLRVEGDELVGTVPHLSTYILTGSTTETNNADATTATTASSPKTYDDILVWIGLLIISGIGILFGAIKFAKVKK